MTRILLLALVAIASRLALCGRFNLTDPNEIVARFGFVDWSEKRPTPRFNIAPSQEIVTIVQEPLGLPFVQTATWGLKPFWAKDLKRPPPINARAESLTASPMFRDALATTRCLVPATGFFEWRVEKAAGSKQRQPMHIRLRGGGAFAFAGLWLPGNRGGPPTATIVTTRPNELMATIHTRMPAMLGISDEHLLRWLDPSLTDAEAALELIQPYPAELMEAYAVSQLVNSWEHESPEVLTPAANQSPLLL